MQNPLSWKSSLSEEPPLYVIYVIPVTNEGKINITEHHINNYMFCLCGASDQQLHMQKVTTETMTYLNEHINITSDLPCSVHYCLSCHVIEISSKPSEKSESGILGCGIMFRIVHSAGGQLHWYQTFFLWQAVLYLILYLQKHSVSIKIAPLAFLSSSHRSKFKHVRHHLSLLSRNWRRQQPQQLRRNTGVCRPSTSWRTFTELKWRRRKWFLLILTLCS